MEEKLFEYRGPSLAVSHLRRDGAFSMDVTHAHTFWEIYYLVSGEGAYYLNGKSYPVRAGTLVFVAADYMHRTAALSHERILFEIDPHFLRGFENVLTLTQTETAAIIQLTQEEREQAEVFLHCIEACLKKREAGCEERAKLYLAGLIAYVGEHAHYTHSVKQPLSLKHQQAEQIIRYIENNYMHPFSLDDIASALFMNKYSLSHLFRRVTGFTVFSYATAVRMQHARALLATTTMRIGDIAEQVGFSSQEHFGRTFHREVGASPIKYRQGKS